MRILEWFRRKKVAGKHADAVDTPTPATRQTLQIDEPATGQTPLAAPDKNGGASSRGPATKAKKTARASGTGRRSQVRHDGYKLFQKGNRYFFSKKAQKDVDGQPVYEMPPGRTVTVTPNGLPVLKKK